MSGLSGVKSFGLSRKHKTKKDIKKKKEKAIEQQQLQVIEEQGEERIEIDEEENVSKDEKENFSQQKASQQQQFQVIEVDQQDDVKKEEEVEGPLAKYGKFSLTELQQMLYSRDIDTKCYTERISDLQSQLYDSHKTISELQSKLKTEQVPPSSHQNLVPSSSHQDQDQLLNLDIINVNQNSQSSSQVAHPPTTGTKIEVIREKTKKVTGRRSMSRTNNQTDPHRDALMAEITWDIPTVYKPTLEYSKEQYPLLFKAIDAAAKEYEMDLGTLDKKERSEKIKELKNEGKIKGDEGYRKNWICTQPKKDIEVGNVTGFRPRGKAGRIGDLCGFRARGKAALKLHLLQVHFTDIDPLVRCNKCRKEVLEVKWLDHKNDECVARAKWHDCDYCNMTWPTLCSLKEHQKTHYWEIHNHLITSGFTICADENGLQSIEEMMDVENFNLKDIRRVYTVPLLPNKDGKPPPRPMLCGITKEGEVADGIKALKGMMNKMGVKSRDPMFMEHVEETKKILLAGIAGLTAGVAGGEDIDSQALFGGTQGIQQSQGSFFEIEEDENPNISVCRWFEDWLAGHYPDFSQYKFMPFFFKTPKASRVVKSYGRNEVGAACINIPPYHLKIMENSPKLKKLVMKYLKDEGILDLVEANKKEQQRWKLMEEEKAKKEQAEREIKAILD